MFAGKLVPFKRPLDLVAAAARLKSDGLDLEVLVAGAGPLEGELEKRAGECGIRQHLLGFRNQTEMPAAYAAADVLVLPSDGNETWGLVANEALACGRPVVLADTVGAAPDLAADGRAGRTYPMGNIAALGDALAEILRLPPTHQAITTKSTAYGVPAAADGIERAVAAAVATGRVGARAQKRAKNLRVG
jgi:glycosyltransferase involved in cell wall biosynthesis